MIRRRNRTEFGHGQYLAVGFTENLALFEVPFNIGINDGAAAGQTVQHLHLHLIPRYRGDVPDPRGGVRWVMPSKAKYWVE